MCRSLPFDLNRIRTLLRPFSLLLILTAHHLVVTISAYGQSTTATLSGIVIDDNEAAVPAAEVTVSNASLGLVRQTVSSDDGTYILPPLPPGSYILSVQRDGFTPIEISNVILSTGDQQALKVQLKVGQVGEQVTVSADAGQLQIQSESGERSDLITNTQINNLALNGRNALGLLKVVPGVVGSIGPVSGTGGLDNITINGIRGNQKEVTIDGSSNVGTGSNDSLHVTINPDAIQEVKVLASNYQAEYGKAGGAYIQFTTKSGTRDFHGSARYFRRHDSLNANEFFNNARGLPRPLYRYDYFGFDISGPVLVPGWKFNRNKEKLFFFFNQEFYKQLRPNNVRNLRVPTALERNGDFSQTTDGNGNPIFISDPLRVNAGGGRLPCTAVNTTSHPGGCFVSNGRLHVIPPERFFRDGRAILDIYPLPNDPVGAARYNFSSQISQDFPRREDIIRIDYNITERTRLTGRFINNPSRQNAPYGGFANISFNFPLFDYVDRRRGYNAALTLLQTLSPTLTNEFIIGPSRQLEDAVAEDDRVTRRARGITSSFLFPHVEGTELLPTFVYGGIANQTFPIANLQPFPRFFYSHTYNFVDNVTKVAGRHTIKTGIFIQRSGFSSASSIPTNAQINFNNDANNPLNSGHPFSNALLGIYTQFQQADTRLIGRYRYNTMEGYLQDNWKVNRRLTLDMGLRLSYLPPQYEENLQTGVFNPELYEPAKAVRLYVPVLVNNQRRAVDPATRVTPRNISNTLPASFIGLIVPNSGDVTNGIGQAKQGYPKGGFNSRGVQLGPRFGFAYKVSEEGNTVLRGGFGITYDRLQANVIIGQGVNPAAVKQPRLFYGYLADLPTASGVPAPSNVTGYSRDGKIPTVYSYSLGIQRNIGLSTLVDVAYVGTLSRHLAQARNINAVPYFTTFMRAAQDPSQYPGGVVPEVEPNLPAVYKEAGFSFSGARALPADLLRPYPGYGSINYREFVGSSNYHSLQAAVNRRFSRGLTFGLAYTWSKVMVTGDEDFETTHPYHTRAYDYRLASFDRTHVFVANYVYDLPEPSRYSGESALMKAVFNNWQLSGISTYSSGAPQELSLTIQGINAGQRITGSYDLAPMFYLRGDPRRSGNGIQINADAFIIPGIGDIGPYPRTYLRNPASINHDLSLFKNFPFGGEGKRYLQLRFEMFNAFNSTLFTSVNRETQLVTAGGARGNAIFNDYRNLLIANNPRPDGSSAPVGQFFGEYNETSTPRIIQLGLKLYF